MKTLGQALIEDREKRDESQDQVAKAVGVTQQAYSEWEKGNTTPRGNRLILLANYFGPQSSTAEIIFAMTLQRSAAPRARAFPDGWNVPGKKRIFQLPMGEQSGTGEKDPPPEDSAGLQVNQTPATYIHSFESRQAADIGGGAYESLTRARNAVTLARQVLDDAANQLDLVIAQIPKK